MHLAASFSAHQSLASLGGLFIACMGCFVLLGSILPRARMPLSYLGFGVGMLALIVAIRVAPRVPRPTTVQLIALTVAIVFEIAAFVTLLPRARLRGERAVIISSLAIVGAHFVIMLPAFGPLVAVLGALCVLNATVAWKRSTYSDGSAWFVDGVLKLAFGVAMIATSPLVTA